MAFVSPSVKDIEETFHLLESWEERYGYVIDLGRHLPPFPEAAKIDANLVKGCTSRVWMITKNSDDAVSFQAESDALIVKGLIAILAAVYNNQSHQAVRDFDIDGFFSLLGLAEHLSPNRRNGFFAIVGRIRQLAQ